MRFVRKAGPRPSWSPAFARQLGVPHSILTVEWKEKPETAIQERARNARYGLLGRWAQEQGLRALAHRASCRRPGRDAGDADASRRRGEGARRDAAPGPIAGRTPGGASAVAWLAPCRTRAIVRRCRGQAGRRSEQRRRAVRAGSDPPGAGKRRLVQFERGRAERREPRPGRRRAALGDDAGMEAGCHQRRRCRSSIARPTRRARSAAGSPRRAILGLATEGRGRPSRPALDKVLAAMAKGQRATLRGVLCIGGKEWRFAKAPPRPGGLSVHRALRLTLLLA